MAIEQNAVNSFGNGVISSAGRVTSATPLADGTYDVAYYVPGAADLQTGNMTISNGSVSSSQFYGALFTLRTTSVSAATYLVEQVDVDDDGLVNVTATEYPADQISSDMSGAGIVSEET